MIFKWLNESEIIMEGKSVYEKLSIERKTVKNIRAGK